jgi:K+-transporting ATPase ATPase C chain
MKMFANSLRASLSLVVVLTILLGGAYPLLVLGLSQAAFHHRASGSLIERGDKIYGSSLLGQEFTAPGYFWGRLSATVPPYNPSASNGSNLSPGNPKLLDAANARIMALQKADSENKARIPVDLVTASASGLDPHISLAGAEYQTSRIARARGIDRKSIAALIAKNTEYPLLGMFGAPYVNVLKLNLALDDIAKE